jgi:hypothetical protein
MDIIPATGIHGILTTITIIMDTILAGMTGITATIVTQIITGAGAIITTTIAM